MSFALYDDLAGLRFWRQSELHLRRRIRDAILDAVRDTLLDINQMWAFEEVETPPMMPLARMSAAYDRADVFVLADPPGGERAFALRAETTDGTYAIAERILRTTKLRPPLCVWQMGTSHRRETRDGATAAKLRLNAFTQLELQLIHAEDTKAEIASTSRRTDFPAVPGFKPCKVVELAFGMDRLVALANGRL
jgi:glycyl-tRNA synthetase